MNVMGRRPSTPASRRTDLSIYAVAPRAGAVDLPPRPLHRSHMPTGTVPLFLVTAVLLGALEGAIVARLFRLRSARSVGWMILANLLVSWLGFLFLPMLPHSDLRREWWSAPIIVVATYALILLLEWPFVALCVRGAPGWFRRSVKGSLVAQTAGYLVLLVIAIVFGGAGRRFAEDDMAALAAMRSDLRNLETAQEAYFADHVTYARRLPDLRGGTAPFVSDSFDVVTIAEASDSGWSATVHREVPPAIARTSGVASLKSCAIFVGRSTPLIAGQPEGKPQCR